MADRVSDRIGFLVEGREVTESGNVKVSVRMFNSDSPQLRTNEFPIILNALKNSKYTDTELQLGFTYTFPFPLARGWGFPYVFDFEIEDDTIVTLI